MKKVFFYMALFAAMAMVNISCSDDDNTDSEDNRLKFANLLTQDSTSGVWEGYDIKEWKELGSWVDGGRHYVVRRFDRASATATRGIGRVLMFENDFLDNFIDASDFTWYFEDDQLQLTYRHSGWAPQHAEYRTEELVIRRDNFTGFLFEKTDYRYKFNYKKSTFKDWDKYKD